MSAVRCWAMNGDGSRCAEPAQEESRFCKYHGRNGGPSPLWIWRPPPTAPGGSREPVRPAQAASITSSDPGAAAAEAVELPLEAMVEDETLSPRLRPRLTESGRLARLMQEQGAGGFPPVVVAGPRPGDSAYVVLDGRYRVGAARQAGLTGFQAVVRPWAEARELFLEAVRLSSRHGLAMTHAEKRRAVDQLVRQFAEDEKSTRELAEIIGVSHNLVAVRRRLLKQGRLSAGESPSKHGAEQYAARLLRAFDRLTLATGGAAAPERISVVLAQAALRQYADAGPAHELALLAAAARAAVDRVPQKLGQAPALPREPPAAARAADEPAGAAL